MEQGTGAESGTGAKTGTRTGAETETGPEAETGTESTKARSLYFTGPREVEVRERPVEDPEEGEVRVRAELSAVSPGTELLVYRDEVPAEVADDADIDSLAGDFEFPLQYGYAVVGRVERVGPGVDSSWLDRSVFGFNPHESHFCAPVSDLLAVPEGCSAESAAFLPNVETAVNLVQDGAPRLGERAAVFGQGVVGLLTTALLAECPLAELVTIEQYSSRRERSLELGADAALDPDAFSDSDGEETTDADGVGEHLRERLGGRDNVEEKVTGSADSDATGADLTYELTGCPDALDSAIGATGYDGRVVVGSWYGTKPAELDLGGRFHRSRISVESSQVSTIAPELRGRWSKDRRLGVAWDRLRDIQPERFVTHEFDVTEAGKAYELLDRRPEEALGVVFTY